jgi:hypothetical protein
MDAMKKLKQIIMVVHARPNTKPGGVQGALSRRWYHAESTPSFVKNEPSAKALKFNNTNTNNLTQKFFITQCSFMYKEATWFLPSSFLKWLFKPTPIVINY